MTPTGCAPEFEQVIKDAVAVVNRLRDIDQAVEIIRESQFVAASVLKEMNLGTGIAEIEVQSHNELYYKILEEVSGLTVTGEHDILRLLRDLSKAQSSWEKIAPALDEVQELGYGVVAPSLDEMILEEPELIRQGNRFGVKLKASAPSLHIIRADITTEITPIIGTEKAV